jgi:predicted N-acetyltransferase YhbS
MDIVSFAHTNVPADLEASAIEMLVEAYGPDDGEGDTVPDPYRAFLTVDRDGCVVGYLSAYIRRVDQNGVSIPIGMIGDVATRKVARHQGVAKRLVAQTHDYFREKGLSFSMLFAYDPPVYISSGYRMMTDEVHFIDGGGQAKTFVHPGSMICDLTPTPWQAGLVHLNGPPV